MVGSGRPEPILKSLMIVTSLHSKADVVCSTKTAALLAAFGGHFGSVPKRFLQILLKVFFLSATDPLPGFLGQDTAKDR